MGSNESKAQRPGHQEADPGNEASVPNAAGVEDEEINDGEFVAIGGDDLKGVRFSFSSSDHEADMARNQAIAKGAGLTEPILLDALKAVAEKVHKIGSRKLRLVTVGGAVNTLLLKSRRTTEDLDFFYFDHAKHDRLQLLFLSAGEVARSFSADLDHDWLNNHTSSLIKKSVIKRLYFDSIAQDRVVFKSHGLKLYAAAWTYSLVQKANRMEDPTARRKAYDIDDAAAYLKEILESERVIDIQMFYGWADTYELKRPSIEVVSRIAHHYKRLYPEYTGVEGIFADSPLLSSAAETSGP